MIKVGIVGGSGYAGQNIIKLLSNHKYAKIEVLASQTTVGEKDEITGINYSLFSKDELNKMDVVFFATPHGVTKSLVSEISTRVIDLSVDHRLTNTYGLPEIHKDEIKNSNLVGNPGCYATACILSAYPIRKFIDHVVFDCISGYSGAGKNAKEKFDYEENIIGYKLSNHFHVAEIEKNLQCEISFTPHVVNAFSGLMATAHIFLKNTINKDIKTLYKEFYKDSYTRIVDEIPQTKDVTNTPFCHVGGFEIDKNNRLVIISVIDNLMKGAASQAIENMNIMFGLDYYTGLDI